MCTQWKTQSLLSEVHTILLWLHPHYAESDEDKNTHWLPTWEVLAKLEAQLQTQIPDICRYCTADSGS